ncbi:unnamed protein product [Caenorhabditis nigoni]
MYRAQGPSGTNFCTPKAAVRFPPNFSNSGSSSSQSSKLTELKPVRLNDDLYSRIDREDSRMFGGHIGEGRTHAKGNASEHHQFDGFGQFENPDQDVFDDYENVVPLPRGASSSQNFWNPSNFMLNTCFHPETGRMYSRETCLENISSLLKKKKRIDFLDILQHKNTEETRNIAFGLMMIDSLVKAPSKSENSIQVYHRDPYFLVYSSPESSRSTDYPRIGDDVFAAFSDVLRAGFNMTDDDVNAISLTSSLRRTTRNYIDKLRKFVAPRQIYNLLDDFLAHLQRDPRFRLQEPPIELDDCHVDAEAHRKRLKRDREPESAGVPTPKSTDLLIGNKDTRNDCHDDYSSSSLPAEIGRNDGDIENEQQVIQKLIQRRSEKKESTVPIKKTPVKVIDSQEEHHRILPMTTRASKNRKKI